MPHMPPVILIMGPSGTGKSRFANLAVDKEAFEETTELESSETQARSAETVIDDRTVEIFDTPGLDADNSEEIKRALVQLLRQMYRTQRKILGIVYMHDIGQNRIGMAVAESYKWLLKTCGNRAMRNVVIVTNMWRESGDAAYRATGQDRERELRDGDSCYRTAFDSGASLRKHDNTRESALAILRELVRKEPVVLQCQRPNDHLRDEQNRRGMNTGGTCSKSSSNEKIQPCGKVGGVLTLLRRHKYC